jgi:S-formylglutathione hydrolase FrmB
LFVDAAAVRLSRVLSAVVLTATSLIALGSPNAVAVPPAVVFADGDGIHVESQQQVDDRLYALSVSTPALGRAVRVRVLLPDGYAPDAGLRYPVLYLFHGTSGGADDWLQSGDVRATTAGLPLIVVMSDAGFDNDGGGWFTNWWDTGTALGPSRWETFHVDQLIPWVDANLQTVATRTGRAIAGLSQGGFGAYTYAARHPDLFAAAASMSGAPDIASNPVVEAGATGVIEYTASQLDGVEPAAMFGPHLTNEINWQGRNPTTLVTNLRGMGLFLYTASGIPGALDGPNPDPAASGIETITHLSTLSFTSAADRHGIPYSLDDYVFGTHSWPYWARDLRDLVPRLMQVFATPSAPAEISYESIDSTWTQWGWTVADHRGAVRAFSRLTDATAAGFTLSGFGSATVTTPTLYVPGSAHLVTLAAPLATASTRVTADASGRLTLDVGLHTLLDLTPGTARVTIG